MSKIKTQDLMIRNSEVHTYKSCRLQWWWSYVQARSPREAAGPLAVGSLWHRVLELWYVKGRKRGASHPAKLVPQAHADMIAAGEYPEGTMHNGVTGHPDPILVEDLVTQMAHNYFDRYEYDDHIEVLVPEMTFQVAVYDPKGVRLGTAVGQIDLTYMDHDIGQVCFMEHKTGASLEPFGAPEHLDEQNAMYWTYGPIFLEHMGLIQSADEIDMLWYNRSAKNISVDDRPEDDQGRKLNNDGSVSKRQPAERFLRSPVYRTAEDRGRLDKRFQQVAKEMRLVRNRKLPVYKNPDRHCNWCAFRDTCEIHETGGDYKTVLLSTTKKWDPYQDHRKKEVVDA